MAGLTQGKVALVTGAGSGIGRQTALAFAREGAQVVVSDIVVEGGKETVQQIIAAGGQAAFVKADVAQAAEVEALVNTAVETYGRIDCAFNNAGIEGRAVSHHRVQRSQLGTGRGYRPERRLAMSQV